MPQKQNISVLKIFDNPTEMQLLPNPSFGSVQLLRGIQLNMAKAILKFYFEILTRKKYAEFLIHIVQDFKSYRYFHLPTFKFVKRLNI